MKQPDARKHFIVSMIKSLMRIIGFCFLPHEIIVAMIILIGAELIGVAEEMV
mgnify:CR=1 FL=1